MCVCVLVSTLQTDIKTVALCHIVIIKLYSLLMKRRMCVPKGKIVVSAYHNVKKA